MRWGDGWLSLAVLVWLSYAVGPWWLGVVLFGVAGFLNYVEERMS